MQVYTHALIISIICTIGFLFSTKLIDWMVDRILKNIGLTIKSVIKFNTYIFLFVQLYLLYIIITNEQIELFELLNKLISPTDMFNEKINIINDLIIDNIESIKNYLIQLTNNHLITKNTIDFIKKILEIMYQDFIILFK